jgi:hypothetical protein
MAEIDEVINAHGGRPGALRPKEKGGFRLDQK